MGINRSLRLPKRVSKSSLSATKNSERLEGEVRHLNSAFHFKCLILFVPIVVSFGSIQLNFRRI
jgi:hypothetical protein